MSYNIDTWKTKELSDLRLPLAALYEGIPEDVQERGWGLDAPRIAPPGVDPESYRPTWREQAKGIACMEEGMPCAVRVGEGSIKGTLHGDVLAVESIDLHGEGSGGYWHYIIRPALAKSTGRLVAVRVWAGGDSVDRVTVVDGEVTEGEVEL